MVEWKFLNDICGIYDGTHQTPKYTDSGVKFVSVENIGAPYSSQKYISEEDYSKNYKTKPQKGDVLMTRIGDVGTCAVLNSDEPIAYYVSLALLRPNVQFVQSNYVKYILESNIGKRELRKKTLLTAVPLKINLGDVGKLKLPIPSISEQERIVGILDTFTASIDNLKEQIAQRRKQYEYYRDQLLDLEGKEGVEMKALGDVCDYVDYRGKTPNKVDYGIFLITAKNIRKGYIDYTNSKEYIAEDDYENVMRRGKPQVGDVLITTEAPCGNVAQIDKDNIALAQRVIKYRPNNDNLNSCYLKYILLGDTFQTRLEKEATGGTVKGIKGSKLHKMTIPIPSISEQQRIVDILDKFEASIQNLEAQLAQREKQYEYYRNKLLTFE